MQRRKWESFRSQFSWVTNNWSKISKDIDILQNNSFERSQIDSSDFHFWWLSEIFGRWSVSELSLLLYWEPFATRNILVANAISMARRPCDFSQNIQIKIALRSVKQTWRWLLVDVHVFTWQVCELNLWFFFSTYLYLQLEGDKNERVCGLSDYDCYYKIMLMFELGTIDNSQIDNCGCMQSCNSIEYEIQVFKSKMTYEHHWMTFNNVSYWIDSTYYGALTISFSDTEYTALKRYASFGQTSFLSDVGGLLSLFLGVSVMSFIELFYLFFIRTSVEFVNYVCRKKKATKVQPTDLSSALEEINF